MKAKLFKESFNKQVLYRNTSIKWLEEFKTLKNERELILNKDMIVKESIESILKPIDKSALKTILANKPRLDNIINDTQDELYKKDLLKIAEMIGPAENIIITDNIIIHSDIVSDIIRFDSPWDEEKMEGYIGEYVVDIKNKTAGFYGEEEDYFFTNVKRFLGESVFKPKSGAEIEKIINDLNGELVDIPGMEDFVVFKSIQRKKEMYYFILIAYPNTKYIYGIDKGNIYMKRADLYAVRELRSGSYAFNKGKPNKMAMHNDLEGVAKWIKEKHDYST